MKNTTVQAPIATVIDNNQAGWKNIIETAPNVTLPVGTPLYLAPPGPMVDDLGHPIEHPMLGTLRSVMERFVCRDRVGHDNIETVLSTLEPLAVAMMAAYRKAEAALATGAAEQPPV